MITMIENVAFFVSGCLKTWNMLRGSLELLSLEAPL